MHRTKIYTQICEEGTYSCYQFENLIQNVRAYVKLFKFCVLTKVRGKKELFLSTLFCYLLIYVRKAVKQIVNTDLDPAEHFLIHFQNS